MPQLPQPERETRPQRREPELPAYHQAARFPDEASAGDAFTQAQALLYERDDIELSAYRFLLNAVYHALVLGDPPPTVVHDGLRTIFAAGEPTQLPEEILKLFNARRQEARRIGPWVEGHHRPDKRLS